MQIQDIQFNIDMLKQRKKRIDGQFRYICECGKIYDNFPALYLHFQRKHDIRISMKIAQSNCSIKQDGNKTLITYFLDQNIDSQMKTNKIYLETGTERRISNMLDQFSIFIVQSNSQMDQSLVVETVTKLFRYLSNYLKHCQSTKIKQIPYYFNGFIIESINREIKLQNYKFTCDILLKLAQWMKSENYTDLIVQYVGFTSSTSTSQR